MIRKILVGALLALGTPCAAASMISGTFTLSVGMEFDPVSSSYLPLSVPQVQTFDFSIPTSVFSVIDYGQTTITQFGELGATAVVSSLDAYSHPSEPDAFVKKAYVILASDDYEANYLTEFAIIAGSGVYTGNGWSSLYTQMRINKYEPSRGGSGSADRSFTADDLVSFLTDYQQHPNDYQVSFFQEWSDFTNNPGGGATYQAGRTWSAYNGDVHLELGAVPEPATWTFMIFGFGAIGLGVRGSKKRIGSTVVAAL